MPTRDLTIRFLASTGDLSKGVDEVHGKLQGVATSLKGIATAGAVVGAANFLKSAIDRASGLNETASKISVVFGKGADAVQRFAADSAAAMGQSKQAALDASATFGVFGKSAGLSGSALSGFSTELTKLASDMASFSNSTPQEAIEAIGAALRGEAEPIQRFGVLLDDATLRQQAFKMGLIKSVSEGLTPANKVLAAHAAIMVQTKDAQGDFSRTSSGLANQQRIAAAQWEDLTAKIGKMFLPAATGVVTFFNTQLIPAGEKVGEALGKIGEQVGPILVDVGSAAKETAGWVWDLPAPVQAAAAAFIAWKLAGDKVGETAGRITAPIRGLGEEIRLQQALLTGSSQIASAQIGQVGLAVAALESRVPTIHRMAEAYREWSTKVSGAVEPHAKLIASIGSFDGEMGRIRSGIEATVTGLGRFAGGLAGVTAATGSLLKTGLTSLVGFLGGPWGIAFTAATAGLGFFIEAQARSRAEAAKLVAASQEYLKVLREQNGVINESVRQAAAKNLEDQGILKMAQGLGISLSQVTDAYINQDGALSGLTGRLNDLFRAGTTYTNAGRSGTVAVMTEQAQAAAELRDKMKEVVGGVDGAVETQKRLTDAAKTTSAAIAGTSTVAVGAVSSAQVLKDATEGLGLKYDEASSAGSKLAAIIKKISDEQTPAIEAEEAYEEAIDRLTESITANGTTLDIHTKKGRDNRDSIESVATAIRDATLADLEAGVPANQAIARHNTRVEALRKEAQQAGLSKAETDKLIAAYAAVPPQVTTYITTRGYEDVVSKLSALEQQQTRLEIGSGARSTRGGQQRYAYGGYVTGPGGPRDDKIPALLSNKEFVQNAAATEHYGVSFMHALNERRIPKDMLPRFARGGTMWPFPVDVSHTKIPDVAAGPVGAIQAFARAQAGKRYQWGATGPATWDCSGLVGALWAVAQGMNPYQRYMTTAGMGVGRHGMKPGPGVFTVYLGPGHTAANVGGLHAEAYGGNGVPLAIGRVGTPLSYYTQVMHLFAQGGLAELRGSRDARTRSFLERGWPEPSTYDQGGWLPPGGAAVNRGTRPEAVLNPDQSAAFVAGARGGTQVVVNITAPVGSQQELEDWLTKSLDNLRRDGRLP